MTYHVNAGITLAMTQTHTANMRRDSNIPADLALTVSDRNWWRT